MLKSLCQHHRYSCICLSRYTNNNAAKLNFGQLYCARMLSSKKSDAGCNDVQNLLEQVKEGKMSVNDASQLLSLQNKASNAPSKTLESFANLDHKRAERTSFPEVIFGQGKTAQQIATILDDMAANVNDIIQNAKINDEALPSSAQFAILATRVDAQLYEELSEIPLSNGSLVYHEMANIVEMNATALTTKIKDETKKHCGKIVICCAGTTDTPVAEEAAITLEAAGCDVERIYDVGVAGLHRILNALPRLRHPDVDSVIVVAGMDGALPSVVAGLVSVPVVAVPTSIGYGASFNGISAMLTMLNSCAPGVGVVNIDNGFGGATLAFKCVQRAKR